VKPKGVQLLQTLSDYDLWLNNSNIESSIPRELNLLGDNVDNPYIPAVLTANTDLIYTWASQFSLDLTATPVIWADHYQSIYYFNTVLTGIDAATGGTLQQKKSLKAEALLGRALEYLYLVNLYGKLYDSTTANTDLAIPFVVSNDISVPVPARSTVQSIYDHIIADLTTAIPDLPLNNNNNRFRGSVAAGYGVLARTYLYMGDYTKASQNAQLALNNGPNAVLDYSTMSSDAGIPELLNRSDAIYGRLAIRANTEYPSLVFLKSFNPKDLRLSFFFNNLGNYSFPTRGLVNYLPYGATYNFHCYPNFAISVAEMRLIIAEAAARTNDLPTALAQLDLVRKCRFKAADYVQYQSTVQADVLNKVLAVRSFEVPYCGIRWFDMKRLDAQGSMAAVTRTNAVNTVIATLAPGSTQYTLQIPIQVLYYHPDWPQNP
jgi:tetratricopeptide (TPR) repeat protein